MMDAVAMILDDVQADYVLDGDVHSVTTRST